MTTPEAVSTEFAPGQCWAYRTRSGEEASRLLVLKVEVLNGEEVVHLSIGGLAMKNPLSPDGVTRQIGHTPIAASALRRSVTHLEERGAELPEDESGYQQWKAAADRGEAGVFTLEVAGLVDAMEEALNTAHSKQQPSSVFGKSNRRTLKR
ncbi:hypothetical protein MF271_13975 [Deinococcus sp. KNUC1210]|uniref:hypothetical protein n=1 Tax=Deinococcus sp. KNUC1210 TaxID=2917691 RepID=UPI001EEFCF3A|nr:hypothetical protein [Deinococcus sp. KNUC1210]ULH15055.1 hypothetical protein MF271_13975 [Deinococcus sp. KNUC1210]